MIIYGRIIYVLTGDPMMSSMKPAPLQFVKLAPSDLYRSAQDQLNKTAAVVVKPKPKEFDAEWQSVSKSYNITSLLYYVPNINYSHNIIYCSNYLQK